MPGAVPDSAIVPGLSPSVSNKTAEAFSAKAFSLTLFLSSPSWSSSLKKILPTFIMPLVYTKKTASPIFPEERSSFLALSTAFSKTLLKVSVNGEGTGILWSVPPETFGEGASGEMTLTGEDCCREILLPSPLLFLLLTIALYYTAYTLTFILHSRFHRENG